MFRPTNSPELWKFYTNAVGDIGNVKKYVYNVSENIWYLSFKPYKLHVHFKPNCVKIACV